MVEYVGITIFDKLPDYIEELRNNPLGFNNEIKKICSVNEFLEKNILKLNTAV